MLKAFIQAFIWLGLALPGAISGIIGLIAAGKTTGFNKLHPEQYQKLVNCVNDLLYVATEHWLGYILLCVILAYLWALLVAEPKAASKRKFDEKRARQIGKGKRS